MTSRIKASNGRTIMPRIYSEMHQNIQNAFNEAGEEIMSPHYTQIRDGSHTTIPADYLPPDYVTPTIKITTVEKKGEKKQQIACLNCLLMNGWAKVAGFLYTSI